MTRLFGVVFAAVFTAIPVFAFADDCYDEDEFCDINCIPPGCLMIYDIDMDRCVYM